jgi:hypothetical protein
MGEVIRCLETKKFKYNIEANTLEEAFIHLGEDKSNADHK